MPDTISCIIVEDNCVDGNYLKNLILELPILNLKAVFENTDEAGAYLNRNKTTLAFLDIEMPGTSGMDFFKNMASPPLCIFVTALSEFAWEGFENHAFDFILKPVRKSRLVTSITRLQDYLDLKERSDIYESQILHESIHVSEGYKKHIIPLHEILYLEALKDYTKVVTLTKKVMTLSKLKNFLELLPGERFIRIHRSYAVAINKITGFDANEIAIGTIKLPIGKTFKENINQVL